MKIRHTGSYKEMEFYTNGCTLELLLYTNSMGKLGFPVVALLITNTAICPFLLSSITQYGSTVYIGMAMGGSAL